MSGFGKFFNDRWEDMFPEGMEPTGKEYANVIKTRLAVLGMILLGGEKIFHSECFDHLDDPDISHTSKDLKDKEAMEQLYGELIIEKENMDF